jgi:putative flippase GtrA
MLRSLLVGLTSSVCDLTVLLVGVELFDLPRIPCVTAGVVTGAFVGFWLNKYFAFRDSGQWVKQAVRYVVLVVMEIGLHTALASVLLYRVELHYLVAKWTADAVIFGVIHLLALRFLVFATPPSSGYTAGHRNEKT